MQTVKTSQTVTAVFSIKESASTDLVTFTIYRASNGAVFLTGSAVHVAGISWKVVFIPAVDDVFVVEVLDQTLDVTYADTFRADSSVVTTETEAVVSTAVMLDLVNAAIATRLKGGAVASYTISGRNIQYMPISDLLALKRDLGKQLAAEQGGSRNYAKFTLAG